MADRLVPHIHFERQEPGSMLCAQHCLNSLLQGQYYDASQLSEIARNLDKLEQAQLDDEAFRSRDEQSLNMDDSGFFSLNVIEVALEVWALSLPRWRFEASQSAPEDQHAFVLNFQSHWFTIRRFGNNPNLFFNLNSFLEKPQWVGKNYLGALLQQAEKEGYSIFVVRSQNSSSTLPWSTADDIAAALPSLSESILAANGSSDVAVSNANAMGLRPSTINVPGGSGFDYSSPDEEARHLEAALRASLADAPSANSHEEETEASWAGQRQTASRQEIAMGDDPDAVYGRDGGGARSTSAGVGVGTSRRRRGHGGEGGVIQLSDSDEDDVLLRDSPPARRRRRDPQPPPSLPERLELEEDGPDGQLFATGPSSGPGQSRRNRRAEREDRDGTFVLDDEGEGGNGRGAAGTRSHDLDDLFGDGGDEEIASDYEEGHASNRTGSGAGHDHQGSNAGVQSGWETHLSALAGPNRDYDDEDAELQAALRASLVDMPGGDSGAAALGETGGWSPGSSLPPRDPVPYISRSASRQVEAKAAAEAAARKAASEAAAAVEAQDKKTTEEEEEDDEADTPSPEEMRRRRLARFGG